jgi:hypothetical protein
LNKVIQGVYQLDSQGPTYRMDLTVRYPYAVFGPGSWSDTALLTATQYAPVLVGACSPAHHCRTPFPPPTIVHIKIGVGVAQ